MQSLKIVPTIKITIIMAATKDTKEEDKVEAAYENISKKLESIRSGKTPEDDEEESDDSKGSKESEDLGDEGLEEWKGPKGMKSEEEEDPLDEEDQKEESKDSKESEEKEENEEEDSEAQKKTDPQPDTLDDLTEDDYDIPNLKGSRQEGYNSSMETTNDPNIFFSQHNQPVPPKRANKFHLLILVVIGVAVIGFTIYILKGGFGEISINPQPSPSPSVQASPTPTPTPEPEVDRGKFTIRVLNGTPTTGLAKTVNDKLKGLGFNTSNPGNASNSAFTQTIIHVKESSAGASLLQRLILDLAPDYEAAESTKLDSSSSYDAEVILGKK